MKLSKYITPLLLATALACPTITLAADISVTNANVATKMPSSGTWDAGKSGTSNNVFSIDEDITIYLTGNVSLKSQINISEGKTLTIINNSTKTNPDNTTDTGPLYGKQDHGVKIDNKMDDNVGGTISSRKCFILSREQNSYLTQEVQAARATPVISRCKSMACATIVGH